MAISKKTPVLKVIYCSFPLHATKFVCEVFHQEDDFYVLRRLGEDMDREAEIWKVAQDGKRTFVGVKIVGTTRFHGVAGRDFQILDDVTDKAKLFKTDHSPEFVEISTVVDPA